MQRQFHEPLPAEAVAALSAEDYAAYKRCKRANFRYQPVIETSTSAWQRAAWDSIAMGGSAIHAIKLHREGTPEHDRNLAASKRAVESYIAEETRNLDCYREEIIKRARQDRIVGRTSVTYRLDAEDIVLDICPPADLVAVAWKHKILEVTARVPGTDAFRDAWHKAATHWSGAKPAASFIRLFEIYAIAGDEPKAVAAAEREQARDGARIVRDFREVVDSGVAGWWTQTLFNVDHHSRHVERYRRAVIAAMHREVLGSPSAVAQATRTQAGVETTRVAMADRTVELETCPVTELIHVADVHGLDVGVDAPM